MKILIYTFRTFPWLETLGAVSNNIIVLNKLKEDVKVLEKELLTSNYNLILGVAKSTKGSKFETKGVNKFNKGRVIKGGKELYSLDYPQEDCGSIKINKGYTTSFCNWGIYRVAEILERYHINTKHMFIHILKDDLKTLQSCLPNNN